MVIWLLWLMVLLFVHNVSAQSRSRQKLQAAGKSRSLGTALSRFMRVLEVSDFSSRGGLEACFGFLRPGQNSADGQLEVDVGVLVHEVECPPSCNKPAFELWLQTPS